MIKSTSTSGVIPGHAPKRSMSRIGPVDRLLPVHASDEPGRPCLCSVRCQLSHGMELRTAFHRSSTKSEGIGQSPRFSPHITSWRRAWWAGTSGTPSPRSSGGKSRAVSTEGKTLLSGSSQLGFRGRDRGTNHIAGGRRGFTTSIRGKRMPRRRRQRLIAAHEVSSVAMSACNCASSSAVEARPRRCCNSPCQLSSRCSFPSERTAGSLTWTPSCPHARRRRAIGHLGVDLPACRCSASSRSVWHPHRTHSRRYLLIVFCLSSSGSAQMYHQHPGVGYGAATLVLGKHERCRRISWR